MASLCKVFLLVVLLCLLHKATADCYSEGKSCDQCYQTLVSFLVNTNDNLYQLQRAFFPPKKTPSVFVAVTYNYSTPNISNQIWFWSAGIFYFYQPLRVFQFTSLFFGNPNWRRNNVTLTLPADCADAPDEFMELLTQLLKLYAKWKVTNPRIDDAYIAVAAKLDTLHDDLRHDPFLNANIPDLLYVFQFLFPALVFLLAILYVKCSYESIMTHVKKQIKHDNWATTTAYAFMCCTFLMYVFALDAVAVGFRDHHFMPTPEFYSSAEDNLLYQYPLMLLVLDVIVFFYIVVVFIIVGCMYKTGKFRPADEADEERAKERAEKIAMYFFLVLFGIAPLLCLASHAHYITIAWITDPVYSGAIGIYYGIIIFMQFFLLKQAYANSCYKKTVAQMCLTWLAINGFQVLITVFFVYIPIKHSIENTPTFLYAFISGSGVLLLLLIAYKVIHDPRGTLSISGTIQNVFHKVKDKNVCDMGNDAWKKLDEEEKLAELMYRHFRIKEMCLPQRAPQQETGARANAASNLIPELDLSQEEETRDKAASSSSADASSKAKTSSAPEARPEKMTGSGGSPKSKASKQGFTEKSPLLNKKE